MLSQCDVEEAGHSPIPIPGSSPQFDQEWSHSAPLHTSISPSSSFGIGPGQTAPMPTLRQSRPSEPRRDIPIPLPRASIAASVAASDASTFNPGSLPVSLDGTNSIASFSHEDPVNLANVTSVNDDSTTPITELKKKCLYCALVTKNYSWASSPYGEFFLRVIIYNCDNCLYHTTGLHDLLSLLLEFH